MTNRMQSKDSCHDLFDISTVVSNAGLTGRTRLSQELWDELTGGAPFDPRHPQVAELCWSLFTALVLDALATEDLVERPAGYSFEVSGFRRVVAVTAMRASDPSGSVGICLDLAANECSAPLAQASAD